MNKDIKLITVEQFEKQVETSQQKSSAFNFIRLGDGEGALLDFDETSLIEDIIYLNEHFGKTVSIEQIIKAKKNLMETIKSSNVLGIRHDIINVEFDCSLMKTRYSEKFIRTFKNNFHLRKTEQDISPFDAIRIAKLYKQFYKLQINERTLCSQWIPFDYFLNGGMVQLILNADKIGIISSRSNIDTQIEKATGTPVKLYQVPDKNIRQGKQKSIHFPDMFEKICENINVEYPGMLFLVGAGLIGKGYCDIIKRKGGIALDIGALIDCWVGIYSRPKVIEDKLTVKRNIFRKKTVPKQLEMTKENIKRLVKIYAERKSV